MKTVAEVDWLVRALTAVKPLLLPKPTVMTPFNVKPTMAGVSWWRSSVDAGSPKLKLVASQ